MTHKVFPVDFATAPFYLTTTDATGAAAAPSSALAAADIRVYKNGNATQKLTANGITVTSPFDSIVGYHQILIDTSNDTGDTGFWVADATYSIMISTAKTVDGITIPPKEIGSMLLEDIADVTDVAVAVRAEMDSNSTQLADIIDDTAEIGIAGAGLTVITDRLPAALVSGRIDASVGAMAANVMTAAAAASDLTTELQTNLATASALATAQTAIDAIPTNAELSTALGIADDVVLAAIAVVQADTDNIQTRLPAALISGRIDASVGAMAADAISAGAWSAAASAELIAALLDLTDGIEVGVTPRQALRAAASAAAGVVSGAGTSTIALSAIGNPGTPRIATIGSDADGNRPTVNLTL